MTIGEEVVKGHCPECRAERSATVAAKHIDRWEEHRGLVWGTTVYRVLKCRGCETIYFQTAEKFSEREEYEEDPETGEVHPYWPEEITHWPAPSKRPLPTWLDDLYGADPRLHDLTQDVYGALEADLAIPAALATRTAFDRASELLGIDPALTFAEKLRAMLEQGKIGRDERYSLAVLTDAGSAAAHRGWRPSVTELDTIVSILEAFLYRVFVLQQQAAALKDKIPTKKKRRA